MSKHKIRNILISIFVVVWTIVFHYESVRYFYLKPIFKKELPQVKFLFPPAGWIMFYKVTPQYGNVEVYGVKDDKPQLIDPHDILRTRTIMYDNIHRNILSNVGSRYVARDFCRFLHYRFPYFERFIITNNFYPDVTKEYFEKKTGTLYQCTEK